MVSAIKAGITNLMQLHRLLALTMVCFALMMLIAPNLGLVGSAYNKFGLLGVLFFSSWVFWCGVRLYYRREHVFRYSTPLLIFTLITIWYAFVKDVWFPIGYYLSLWWLPNFFTWKQKGQVVTRAGQWLDKLSIQQAMAVILLLIWATLSINLYPIALVIIYNHLSFIPHVEEFYRGMFLVGGLVLWYPGWKYQMVQVCVSPIMIHAMLIVLSVVFGFYSTWSPAPMVLFVVLIWWRIMEVIEL